MSCRVMARGVGSVMLSYIINLARMKGKELYAEYIPNDRNRMMLITFRFMKFVDAGSMNGRQIFRHDLREECPYPDYMEVDVR
jgi:predicted enzyme involved in methoxymalonyl-ACP biosynthesis